MRKFRIILLCLSALIPLSAAGQEPPVWELDIEEVVVRSRRALTRVGAQRTAIDSVAMREDISRSMADVLARSTGIFIKSYGRATLATASIRGTAASHTQVTWNEMKINSPMLGQVDFSLIPSYFVDDAALYHGGSSVGVTGGGLGGAVALGTKPPADGGFGATYVQGIGSFGTWDEYLRLSYGGARWRGSLRVFHGASENEFEYTNYNKQTFIYDDEHNIVNSYYPREKNRNGGFRDFHIMPELYYDTRGGDHFSLVGWYMDSDRGIPFLNTDYKDDTQHRFRQREKTARLVAGWERMGGHHRLSAKAGYTYTDFNYTYRTEVEQGGGLRTMIDSRNFVNTFFGRAGGEYYLGEKWLLSADVAVHQHIADCRDRVVRVAEQNRVIGYKESRFDFSAFASVRWRPIGGLGLAINLREELYGNEWSPAIPALLAEYSLWARWGVVLKASAARNYRYPTLNDRYFMPGGNPDLRPEKGVTFDAGFEFGREFGRVKFSGEATFYDSRIDDWILWMPQFASSSAVWTPVNIKQVHSYGVELKGTLGTDLWKGWRLTLDGNYTLAKAINRGDKHSGGDRSVGRQLPYMPVHSANVTGRLAWRGWTFAYMFGHYSRRFTSTDNSDYIGAYYMSDISFEKAFTPAWGRVSLKLAVNNLFDEEYEMLVSRPMPGRNFGLYISVTPNFKKK